MTGDSQEYLAYIPRIRAYYAALGYGAPYEWAQLDSVPITRLAAPLAQTRVAIVTTATRFNPAFGPQGPLDPYNGAAKFFEVYAAPVDPEPDLRIAHIAYDRTHTTAADQGTYFPLAAMRRLAARGIVGAVHPEFFGLPTNRSQRTTRETDCPELVALCKSGGVEAVVLVPNCPVCHQSTALAAHALESAGIPAVIMGCARDIVEHVGAPRLYASNFPLGNSAGRPHDPQSQDETLRHALSMLETVDTPRTTHLSSQVWSGDPHWQDDYSNADRLSAEEITARKTAFDRAKVDATRRKGA